ncbi:MAG TPA: hypothetical protein DCO75_06230 [Fibrobacteres bacterium]|nr:hypothetical protein [Fibrobacterota bacterium]
MNSMQSRNVLPVPKVMGMDYYIPHYLNLIWRWKWYICIVTPVIFVAWAIGVIKFGNTRPALESSAVLQFMQSSGTTGPIDNETMLVQKSSCDAFIHSRSFIENISDKLSLRLSVKKYFRSEIFDSISIDKDAAVGKYDFVVGNDGYSIYYSNKKLRINKKIVISGRLIELSSFFLPSILLKLTNDFVSEPHSFTFFISTQRQAVDNVLKYLSTKFPGSGERDNSIMAITLQEHDYPLGTQVVNEIADEFVQHNSEQRLNTKNENVEVLEKQLQEARNNLAGADNALRQFREVNSNVGVTNSAASSVSELVTLENSVNSLKSSITEANVLQARCQIANSDDISDDKMTALNEAITYLASRQSVAAPALQSDFNEASADKKRVDAEYAPQHPRVIENRKKIARIAANISKALSDAVAKMRADAVGAVNRKDALTSENQRLPAQELRYSDLMRKRDNAEELFTNLLSRYNISKMSAASQSSFVTIMDHAVVPNSPSRLQSMLRVLLIGLVIALVFGFGLPAGIDYLDKRARNEGDCRRFSALPFLEGIPKKNDSEKNNVSKKEKIDDKLVAAGFEPDTFDEMYRSLRTKILLHLHGEAHKMLVVTSLNAGEGKSLTASNLAIVMAQQKLRTLLIDGDMRRGVQHNSFVLEKKPGLSEIISSPDELTTMPVSSFIQKAHIPDLSLLSCGMPIPNPAECMNSSKFRDLTAMLAEWFDVIVLDTPPLRVAVDAAILPEAFSHYIIVVRAVKTNIVALEKKIVDFPGLYQKVLGIVLNGAPIDKKMHNYTYSYYRH